MRAKNAKKPLNQDLNVSQKWFSKDGHKTSMVVLNTKPQMIQNMGQLKVSMSDGLNMTINSGAIIRVPQTN